MRLSAPVQGPRGQYSLTHPSVCQLAHASLDIQIVYATECASPGASRTISALREQPCDARCCSCTVTAECRCSLISRLRYLTLSRSKWRGTRPVERRFSDKPSAIRHLRGSYASLDSSSFVRLATPLMWTLLPRSVRSHSVSDEYCSKSLSGTRCSPDSCPVASIT